MEENNIIELVDENGEAVEFEHLMTLEHEGDYYIVLMAPEAEEGAEPSEDEGEVLILKIEKDPETDENIYVTVEDEEVSQAVFNQFVAMMDEEEDE